MAREVQGKKKKRKSNSLVDLILQIGLVSKFLARGEILKKFLPYIEIPWIILKVSIRKPSLFFLRQDEMVNSQNNRRLPLSPQDVPGGIIVV